MISTTIKPLFSLSWMLCLATLMADCCYGAKGQEIPFPNVVIVLSDDLGYGDISCYSQDAEPTPNIDKLARQGVRCTDFYVPTVSGRAWITGTHQFMLDPDDPWPEGYRVTDTWPVIQG